MATGSESVRNRSADRATGAVGPGAAEPTHLAEGGRPWWIWAIPFALLFALLCARNGFLFTTRLYEQGDAGANSILITQAKHFTLLIGSYSREGFNHPGPAYMYVQALGEYLFLNALHVVPTAWNAHVLSVFVLDSAFLALAVGIVYSWTRSLAGAAATFAVFLGLAVVYPPVVNSDWMPYLYVPTYVVFLLAAGSVTAGRVPGPVDPGAVRLVPHSRARVLPAVRTRDHPGRAGRRGGRAPAGHPPVDPVVLRRAAEGLDPGRGHQRGLRVPDRAQPDPALAGRLR